LVRLAEARRVGACLGQFLAGRGTVSQRRDRPMILAIHGREPGTNAAHDECA
jgi:hypothetical protein